MSIFYHPGILLINNELDKLMVMGKLLRDPLNRRIDYIRVSVTESCNLRCIYCIPEGRSCFRRTGMLSEGQILGFLKVALRHGLKKVRLTGGEPLLRSDIIRIVAGLKEMGVADISLTTNGLLLPEFAVPLAKAGLGRVNISLDSFDPVRYKEITRGGDIKAVFRAIEEAEKAGLSPLKINMVPIRGFNENEIGSFASYTIDNPHHVRFIELMPLKRGLWSEENRVPADEILGKITELGRRLIPLGEQGSARNYRLDGARGVIGLISPMSNHFCASCNRLRLTARGFLRGCLFSGKEIDIKQARSEGELEELLLLAVRTKPAGRDPGARIPARSMSQLGG
jgi:cyclic pyranopterin phosphate synthase